MSEDSSFQFEPILSSSRATINRHVPTDGQVVANCDTERTGDARNLTSRRPIKIRGRAEQQPGFGDTKD